MPAAFKRPQNLFLAEQHAHELLQESVRGFLCLDEVGRGCLAGPVVAGVSAWVLKPLAQKSQKTLKSGPMEWLHKVRDSKKLTEKSRNSIFEAIASQFPRVQHWTPESELGNAILCHSELHKAAQKPLKCSPPSRHLVQKICKTEFECVGMELGASTAQEIDSHNIWQAAQLAMGRALLKLLDPLAALGWQASEFALLVDGSNGIVVPTGFQNCPQLTSVGGDDLFVSIGYSSIAAKVARDRFMGVQGRLYPVYGFEQHKGYATRIHVEALQSHGVTPLHRGSFLRNILPNTLFSQNSLVHFEAEPELE